MCPEPSVMPHEDPEVNQRKKAEKYDYPSRCTFIACLTEINDFWVRDIQRNVILLSLWLQISQT